MIQGNNRDLVDGELYPSVLDDTKLGYGCTGEAVLKTFTIFNTGSSEMSLNTITMEDISDDAVSKYSLTQPTSPTVAAGSSTTFDLEFTFAGESYDPFSRAKVLVSNTDGEDFEFGVSTTLDIAQLQVQLQSVPDRKQDSIDLSTLAIGTTLTETVKLVNLGGCSADIAGTSIVEEIKDGVVSSDFSLVSAPASTSLATGESALFDVEWDPTGSSGVYTAIAQTEVTNGADFNFTLTGDLGINTESPTPAPITTFDWGADCEAGNGAFTKTLEKKRSYVDIGEAIPTGKFDVYIGLETQDNEDLDVWLFDLDVNRTTYPEGKALVRYCTRRELRANSGVDCGYIGQSDEPDWYVYKGMNITYSGWFEGSEYIWIPGSMTKTTLQMKAYAYATGTATVTYSWAASCLGTPFTSYLPEKDIEYVGTVPVGLADLTVFLSNDAGEDVDIQLYDADDTTEFDVGAAIVAYCGKESTCNFGHGLTDDAPQSGYYDSSLYIEYSGWDGIIDPLVDLDTDEEVTDNTQQWPSIYAGQETITILGLTDRNLNIYSFGYKAGQATVMYWWTLAETLDRAGYLTGRA